MRWIAIMIVALLPCLLVAQISMEEYNPIFTERIRANKSIDRVSTTIGSPNVFEEFMTGYVYFSDNTRSTERMINYNCFDNEVLYQDEGETYILNARMIDSLEFKVDENTSRIFKKVILEDKRDPLFLSVLYSDHSILYKRYYKEFREADIGKAYGSGQRNDEYIDRFDYYIAIGNGGIQSFKPRKKNVLELMEAHGEEIENFLKKDKISLKSESDLIKLLGYYDSLSTPSQ